MIMYYSDSGELFILHVNTLLQSSKDRHNIYTTSSQEKSRYENNAGQTFSTLIRFVENTCNIYISK
jgi:hypothetical protein